MRSATNRVLLVSGSLPPEACGVGDYASRLATALTHAGMDVQILTTAGPERAERAKVDLRATVRSWSIFNLAAVRKQIRELRPGVVHLQYPTVAYGAGLMPQALVLSGAPFVVTIHEASISHVLRRMSLYPFLVLADRVIATTRFEADFLVRMYPPARGKMAVIPIGSNIPPAPPRPHDGGVVYFGLIAPNKGLESFLSVAGMARDAGQDWRFQVVGTPQSKRRSYARSLYEASRRLGIEWHANLPAEEVAAHLAAAGAVYLPFPDGASLRRGSLIAALVNGAPVVTTRGRATPGELVVDETVVFANSPETAYGRIKDLFSRADLGDELSRRAIEYARRFSWPRIAEQHASLYAEVASKRARGMPRARGR
jgi:glycosyltransferase involved in cell wall biosynthesis